MATLALRAKPLRASVAIYAMHCATTQSTRSPASDKATCTELDRRTRPCRNTNSGWWCIVAVANPTRAPHGNGRELRPSAPRHSCVDPWRRAL
eukprot:3533779-Prymnesium_polylepis.1